MGFVGLDTFMKRTMNLAVQKMLVKILSRRVSRMLFRKLVRESTTVLSERSNKKFELDV